MWLHLLLTIQSKATHLKVHVIAAVVKALITSELLLHTIQEV